MPELKQLYGYYQEQDLVLFNNREILINGKYIPREDEGKRGNPHIGPIPIVIPLKLFLDLPLDPVSQEN